MDVAKYIGLFLLKHNKCFVHGLGTLEMRTKSATYDGESLHGPIKEILLSTSGNIDEALSNFIATNEQISISKATKELHKFSDDAKQRIAQGETVPIPALGKLAEENGKIYFITAPQLQFRPEAIKAPKSPPRRSEPSAVSGFTLPQQPQMPQPGYQQQPVQPQMPQPQEGQQEAPDNGRKLNWARIILVLLILVLLAAATFIGWKFYSDMQHGNRNNTPPPPPQEEYFDDALPVEDEMPSLAESDSLTTDTTNSNLSGTKPDTVSTLAEPTELTIKMKVILNTYDSKERAHKRYRQLTSYGNKVEMIQDDTNYFFIAMPITASAKDTARILDSLSRNFNPDGVFIY